MNSDHMDNEPGYECVVCHANRVALRAEVRVTTINHLHLTTF